MVNFLQASEKGQSEVTGEGPKVVTLRAVSVTEPAKTPSDLPESLIRNSEMDMDPYNEEEVYLLYTKESLVQDINYCLLKNDTALFHFLHYFFSDRDTKFQKNYEIITKKLLVRFKK